MPRKITTDVQIVAYICLLVIAEYTVTRNQAIGMIVHGCILFALLAHGTIGAIATGNAPVSRMYTALAIAPLLRILSLCVPLVHFGIMSWFVIVGIPLFVAIFTYIRIRHIDKKSLGLASPDPAALYLEFAIIAAAIPLGWLEYQMLEPTIAVSPGTSWIVPIIIFLVCTGFLEELLFRGLLQHTFTAAMEGMGRGGGGGGMRGILAVSAIFGIFHIGNSWLDCIFAGVVGLMYALVVRRTGSIYGVSISHGLINIMLFLVIPYLALSC